MNSNIITMILKLVSALLVSIFLSACAKNGASTDTEQIAKSQPSPQLPTTEAGGGIDGSGGDAQDSTLEEVKLAFEAVIKELPNQLSQMHKNLMLDVFSYEYRYGKGSHGFIHQYLMGRPRLGTGICLGCETVGTALIKGLIKIKPVEDSCTSTDGHRDGSALGGMKDGEICISFTRLTRIPTKSLKEQIFLLINHELSHLSGFDEPKAKKLQSLLSAHPGIYLEGNKDPVDIQDFPKCDNSSMEAALNNFKASPYWKHQRDLLLKMLSGRQNRICQSEPGKEEPRLAIFAADAELLQNTGKFVQDFLGYSEVPGGKPKIELSVKDVHGLTNTLSMYIRTDNAVLPNVEAKVGTDAQCNPRVFIANLVANVPSIVEKPCGSDANSKPSSEQSRINKELEILTNESNEEIKQECTFDRVIKFIKSKAPTNSIGGGSRSILEGDRELILYKMSFDHETSRKSCHIQVKCDPLKEDLEVVEETCP